jgi:hypothetical protein
VDRHPVAGRVGAAGVVFDLHFAGRADAAGARREWRSGRYHLPAPGDAPPADSQGPDLIACLRARGVHTCLISDDSRAGVPGFEVGAEFAAGWDEVIRIESGRGEGPPLDQTLEAAFETLDRLAGRDDWLLWLDLATLLPPWDLPDEFLGPYFTQEEEEETGSEEEAEEEEEEGEEEEPLCPVEEVAPGPIDPADDRLFLSHQSTFAAAISYLDTGVGQLLEDLHQRQGGDQIIVVFTADCGLPLGEHGVMGLVRPWPHE